MDFSLTHQKELEVKMRWYMMHFKQASNMYVSIGLEISQLE